MDSNLNWVEIRFGLKLEIFPVKAPHTYTSQKCKSCQNQPSQTNICNKTITIFSNTWIQQQNEITKNTRMLKKKRGTFCYLKLWRDPITKLSLSKTESVGRLEKAATERLVGCPSLCYIPNNTQITGENNTHTYKNKNDFALIWWRWL